MPQAMGDLFAISQLIKCHPCYKLKQYEIHQIYKQLGGSKDLSLESLLRGLKENFPDLSADLQRNFHSYCKIRDECIRLSLRGFGFVCYGEDLYPQRCYFMEDPPLTISYLGSPAWLLGHLISVVGSREPQQESLVWMEKEFAPFCENMRPVVVSGGARGIDQKAHSIALRKSVSTIIVLPSGLDEIYPQSLSSWIEPVLSSGGCFLSEYPFTQKMHKHLFFHRNRMIAALGQATLLIEAKKRSGSMITAQKAIQIGSPVWVIPGHPLDPHFAGSLELLSEGAIPIRDAQDLAIFYKSEIAGKSID